ALLDQALRPVADRLGRDAERGLLGLADTIASGRDMLPREEGEDGAGLALLVAVIEVIGAGIVEVDGLLHQAQAERAGVEVDIARGVARYGRDVMNAGHGGSPAVCDRGSRVLLAPQSRPMCRAGNAQFRDQTVSGRATIARHAFAQLLAIDGFGSIPL